MAALKRSVRSAVGCMAFAAGIDASTVTPEQARQIAIDYATKMGVWVSA
jgi:hypothetical protein